MTRVRWPAFTLGVTLIHSAVLVTCADASGPQPRLDRDPGRALDGRALGGDGLLSGARFSVPGDSGTPSSAGGNEGRTDAGTDASMAGVGAEAGAAASNGGASAGFGGTHNQGLRICVRLDSPHGYSYTVTRVYERKVFADCRVKWVTRLYLDVQQRDVFLNDLVAWNLQLWGCTKPVPNDFRLIFGTAKLTTADVTALIDHYLDAAKEALKMSSVEIADMRRALEQLSKDLTVASSEFSHAACGGAGGAGGAASAGASGLGGAESGGASGSGGSGSSGGTNDVSGAGGMAGTAGTED